MNRWCITDHDMSYAPTSHHPTTQGVGSSEFYPVTDHTGQALHNSPPSTRLHLQPTITTITPINQPSPKEQNHPSHPSTDMTTDLNTTTNHDPVNEYQNEDKTKLSNGDTLSPVPATSNPPVHRLRQRMVLAVQCIYLVVGSLTIMSVWAVMRG